MPTKSEKFSNLGESTVDSSYTSGATSLVVADASTFPTDGIFRVRIDNPSETIWRVDSVSGDTFTGAAEENDGNASVGVDVVQVGTKAQQERHLQSPLDGAMGFPTGLLGADRGGPGWKLIPLDQSSWSWVNQGGFSVTQGGGVVYLDGPAAAGTNLRCRVKTAPSAPYVIEAGVMCWFGTASSLTSLMAAGLVFRESGTGEITILAMSNFTFATANSPPSVFAANYNSATSANAEIGTARNSLTVTHVMWLRITDNNTNLIFEASIDKVNWFQIASISRTSFMAGGPDQVGIFATNQAGATQCSAAFIHWAES